MNLIDLHCDTVGRLFYGREEDTLKNNDFSINLGELQKAHSMAQFFACFIDLGQFPGNDAAAEGYRTARKMMERLKREVENFHDEIAFAKRYEELLSNREAGKISAVLTVEEGGILGGNLSALEELYAEGVRLVTLLWNYENCIGSPNSRSRSVMEQGLKPFGFEVVEQMNALGMIIDVSHMSDGGFWDVIRSSKAPVIASHSNMRALCAHPRNLTDEMLRAIAEKGGVAGLNFYPAFVREDQVARAEDLARHIRRMVQVGGEEVAAIGTDFDGFDGGELEIPKMGQIDLLWHALEKEGFTSAQIDKFRSGNVLRVMKEIL